MRLKRPEVDNVKTIALVGYTGTTDLSHSSDKGTSTGFGAITTAIKEGATGDDTATRRQDLGVDAGIARTMGIDSDENETAAMLEAATTAFGPSATTTRKRRPSPRRSDLARDSSGT